MKDCEIQLKGVHKFVRGVCVICGAKDIRPDVKRQLGLLLVLVGLAVVGLVAQTSPKVAWDQAAPSAAAAQGWTYRYYVDGGATGTLLAGVTCSGATSPFACSATFPTLTPGPHSLQLTAAATAVSESVKSDLLFVNTPAPQNLRTQ